MTTQATKITIVTERMIQSEVTRIIEDAGASGYTVVEGSGKGQHGLRSSVRPQMVGAFSIVKIETLVADRGVADTIAERVIANCFQQFSGIVYLSTVEILRPERF